MSDSSNCDKKRSAGRERCIVLTRWRRVSLNLNISDEDAKEELSPPLRRTRGQQQRDGQGTTRTKEHFIFSLNMNHSVHL